jgi:pimeloyl-ACP methyl ester carboxylesterase
MAVPRNVTHLALAVVAGLALAVGIDVVRVGGIDAWLATRHLPTVDAAQGARVDIGGRALYLDCRGQGSPTIVLEAGMGDGARGWSPVIGGLAATSRACAYDRAGRGASDPRGLHTVADAADDLRSLLAAAGEAPPFIVVGHSLGEVYARVFADRYRSEVGGLVLVDGFSVDLESDWIHPLLGEMRPEYEARLDTLRHLVANVEALDWAASERQLRGSDVGGIPIAVLRAPRAEPRLDEATNVSLAAAWERAYASLSPGLVHYELAWGAGHVIQADRPDLVIAAVARLVADIR